MRPFSQIALTTCWTFMQVTELQHACIGWNSMMLVDAGHCSCRLFSFATVYVAVALLTTSDFIMSCLWAPETSNLTSFGIFGGSRTQPFTYLDEIWYTAPVVCSSVHTSQ